MTAGGSILGCTDDTTTTTAGATTTVGEATSTSAVTPTSGGTLRVALIGGGTTDSIDPNTLLSSPDFARTISLYEPLTFRQYDWTLGFVLAGRSLREPPPTSGRCDCEKASSSTTARHLRPTT